MMETGIGYNRGHFGSSKLQGIGLTAKLGIEGSKFFVAADVGYHDLQLGNTPTSTQTNMGVAIGGIINKWRIWYTHLLSSSLVIESGGNETEYTGKGMKLGLGGEIASDIFLNLEVRFIDITEANGEPTTNFIDAGLLSVSWKLF